MSTQYVSFFKRQYEEAGLQPETVSLYGNDIVIPLDYMKKENPGKAFMEDFLDGMRADMERYENAGLKPRYVVWYNNAASHKLVVPFDWRDRQLQGYQVAARVLARAEVKYRRVEDLLNKLNQEKNGKTFKGYVSAVNARSLERAWQEKEQKTTQPQKYLKNKVERILRTGVKATQNNRKWTLPRLNRSARMMFAKIAVAASVLVGTDKALRHHRAAINEAALQDYSEDTRAGTSSTSLVSLDPQVISNLPGPQIREIPVEKEESISNHDLFMQNIDEMIACIAYVEKFKSTTYDDKKGNLTIGYGTTFYLNEKGQNIGSVKSGDHITKEQAAEQTRRYLIHVVAKQIDRYVKVPLDRETMLATAQYFYLLSPAKIKKSVYLERLNNGEGKERLANAFTQYSADRGVPKRCLIPAALIMGDCKASEILDLYAGSCYNLDYKEVVHCNARGDKIMTDGCGSFRWDCYEENLSALRQSFKGGQKVANILPRDVVETIKMKKLTANNEAHYQQQVRANPFYDRSRSL